MSSLCSCMVLAVHCFLHKCFLCGALFWGLNDALSSASPWLRLTLPVRYFWPVWSTSRLDCNVYARTNSRLSLPVCCVCVTCSPSSCLAHGESGSKWLWYYGLLMIKALAIPSFVTRPRLCPLSSFVSGFFFGSCHLPQHLCHPNHKLFNS